MLQHCKKCLNNQDLNSVTEWVRYILIYLSLPSGSDILRYILNCRAIAIYGLPINLRYIYKRVSSLLATCLNMDHASDQRPRPPFILLLLREGLLGEMVPKCWIWQNCNTSTHPSRVYINQIQKNFFPKTSLEGQTTQSKMRGFYIVDFHSALTWPG